MNTTHVKCDCTSMRDVLRTLRGAGIDPADASVLWVIDIDEVMLTHECAFATDAGADVLLSRVCDGDHDELIRRQQALYMSHDVHVTACDADLTAFVRKLLLEAPSRLMFLTSRDAALHDGTMRQLNTLLRPLSVPPQLVVHSASCSKGRKLSQLLSKSPPRALVFLDDKAHNVDSVFEHLADTGLVGTVAGFRFTHQDRRQADIRRSAKEVVNAYREWAA